MVVTLVIISNEKHPIKFTIVTQLILKNNNNVRATNTLSSKWEISRIIFREREKVITSQVHPPKSPSSSCPPHNSS